MTADHPGDVGEGPGPKDWISVTETAVIRADPSAVWAAVSAPHFEPVLSFLAGGGEPFLRGGQILQAEHRGEQVIQMGWPVQESLKLRMRQERPVSHQRLLPPQAIQSGAFLSGDLHERA